MDKNKKRKVIESTVLGLGSICALTNLTTNVATDIIEKTNDKTGENMVGYENIGAYSNLKVYTNNFVILHVNKNSDVGLLRKKIERCNENNISLGLVIDSNADELYKIYEEIDFVQSVIKEYKVELPVYFNIDYIMESPKLNNMERKAIIDSFFNKTEKSCIYSGLYGKDSYLAECNQYVTEITNNDCFLVKDQENVQYAGSYNIVKELDGKITAKMDLAEIITSKNLNSADGLKVSGVYKVKEGDTYRSIALKYGLSTEDLQKYHKNPKHIKVDDEIFIPNLYNEKRVVSDKFVATGIDISNWQVDNINWNRVKQVADYVIVAVSADYPDYQREGKFLNTCFNQIEGVLKSDLDLGLYFVIEKGMNVNLYKEKLENYLVKLEQGLKEKNITLNKSQVPVFLDFESFYEYNDYYKLINAFSDICKSHGFTQIGIYANQSTFNSINSNIQQKHNTIISNMDIYVWVAGGPQYSSNEGTNIDDLTISELVEPQPISNDNYSADLQQLTNVCIDTGAPDGRGHCDVTKLVNPELFSGKYKEYKTEVADTTFELDLKKYSAVSSNVILNSLNLILTALYVVVFAKVVGDKLIVGIKKRIKQKEEEEKTLTKIK